MKRAYDIFMKVADEKHLSGVSTYITQFLECFRGDSEFNVQTISDDASVQGHPADGSVFVQNFCPAYKSVRNIREKFRKCRIVYVVHDMIWLSLFNGDVEGYVSFIRRAGEKPSHTYRESLLKALYVDTIRACGLADAVVCLNPDMVRLMRDFYMVEPAKIHLIRNGLSDPCSDSVGKSCHSDSGRIRIIYAGRFTEQKGFDVLLKAFDMANRSGCLFELVCCGDKMPENLYGISKDCADLIKWAGCLPHDELMSLMHRCDLGFMPSRFEQSGYSGIEMKASGLPLIVSDGFGVSDLGADGSALVFKSGDAESLASVMIDFASMSEQERLQLVRKSREDYRRRYSIDAMRNSYRLLLDSILRKQQ